MNNRSKYYKYQRTPHLPGSGGATDDDRTWSEEDLYNSALVASEEIVISCKMDGENTNFYNDHYHARSIDSRHHPSRDWAKRKWGEVSYKIPEGWKVALENVFACHSIFYNDLESFLYVISLWDEERNCLDWDATVDFAENELQLPTVPVLYRGPFDIDILHKLADDLDPNTQEGYVVRTASGFHYEDFGSCVAKYVSSEFKEMLDDSDEHWMHKQVVPNKLKDDEE